MKHAISLERFDRGAGGICRLAHQHDVRKLRVVQLQKYELGCGNRRRRWPKASAFGHHGASFYAHSGTRPHLKNRLQYLEKKASTVLYFTTVVVCPDV